MLGSSKRLQICVLLSRGECDVNSLAPEIGLSQSALSQHLGRLHRAGLVSVRKQAQFISINAIMPPSSRFWRP
ncbi:ArsR/SmtB family transcription factor [Rhizobium tropici]|uniref:HTH arsR-type domain-containing protein n=1 Tax=Rhizobium tropici TaxID=398 RepID=A0A329Y270_RHITR|nr:hypothetical protein DQ393_30040 [Rhizobium tropici]